MVIRLTAILAASLLLAGCCDLDKALLKDYQATQAKAAEACAGRGQQLYAHYRSNGSQVVLCSQQSPFRIARLTLPRDGQE